MNPVQLVAVVILIGTTQTTAMEAFDEVLDVLIIQQHLLAMFISLFIRCGILALISRKTKMYLVSFVFDRVFFFRLFIVIIADFGIL